MLRSTTTHHRGGEVLVITSDDTDEIPPSGLALGLELLTFHSLAAAAGNKGKRRSSVGHVNIDPAVDWSYASCRKQKQFRGNRDADGVVSDTSRSGNSNLMGTLGPQRGLCTGPK